MRTSAKLTGASEFKAVFEAKCSSSGEFFLVFGKANGTDRARLGLTISKRLCRTAVGRNYMKRVVRELFRRYTRELSGLDVVVCQRKAFGSGSWSRLLEEFGAHALRLAKCRSSSV